MWSMRESLLEALHSGQLRSNKCQKRDFSEVQCAAMLDTKIVYQLPTLCRCRVEFNLIKALKGHENKIYNNIHEGK